VRTNSRLFWILAGFFVLADIVYIVWSILYSGEPLATKPAGGEASKVEWVGTVGLGLTAILAGLIAFYLGRANAAAGGVLPEDRTDGNIEDGDGEQGTFSPWSWWPIMLAASAALVFLGLAVGPWIALIGAPIALISLVGWVFEYYRGYFAR